MDRNNTLNQSVINAPMLTPVYIPSNYQLTMQKNTNTFNNKDFLQKEHIKLLQNIKDKAFVTSILCSKSCAFFHG
jgi:hypothetical protein